MLKKQLKIGTRATPLALKQVEEVLDKLRRFYPKVGYEIIGIDTYGDKDKITPLSDMEGSDFFTREIEQALLRNEIDFAVHSAKDMPEKIPEGLVIAAMTKSIDPYDALVSCVNLKINELKPQARIGASSMRRKAQLKQYRTDLQILDIRGNIQERLEKLDKNKLDAIVVAACALVRLGLENRITQRIPRNIMAPHPLQGALAVETRKDNRALEDWLGVLNEK